MRKVFPILAVCGLFVAASLSVLAAEEKTITGDATCAKCALKEAKSCQNVVTVKEGDTRIETHCGKCGAVNRIKAPRGQSRVEYACKECGHKQKAL